MNLDFPPECIKQDRYQRVDVARSIAYQLNTAGRGFNFLLSGDWGTGKTSLLFFLKEILEKNPHNKVVWFNPWKYLRSSDNASVSKKLLIEIRRCLGSKHPETDLYESEAYETTAWGKLLPSVFSNVLLGFVWFVSASLIILSTGYLFRHYTNTHDNVIGFYKDNIIIPLIISTLPVFSTIVTSIKKRSMVAESVEQFEKLFNKELDKSIYDRVIIFIDDLDRCSEGDVQQLLSSLFTVFEHRKCYYVVAADLTVLAPFAGASVCRNPDEKTEVELYDKGRSYLKKIFQFIYTIQPLPMEKIDDEIDKALGKYVK